MATRIALEQELTGTTDHAFTVLRDREVTIARLALEPALDAELVAYSSSPTSLDITIVGQLPAHWLPSAVSATPSVQRTESWKPGRAGFQGRMTMTVHGMPITCTGTLSLEPWQNLTVLSMVIDLEVALPFVAQTVERMIRDRMEPAFLAEFEYLAAEVARRAVSS